MDFGRTDTTSESQNDLFFRAIFIAIQFTYKVNIAHVQKDLFFFPILVIKYEGHFQRQYAHD
jgi:hypothetical protein